MSVIVFAGPTIDANGVTDILQAHVLPPVKQGDVYRAVSNGPKAIGIIDGYFEGVPSNMMATLLFFILTPNLSNWNNSRRLPKESSILLLFPNGCADEGN